MILAFILRWSGYRSPMNELEVIHVKLLFQMYIFKVYLHLERIEEKIQVPLGDVMVSPVHKTKFCSVVIFFYSYLYYYFHPL